eukprot:366300-Chlamydomonas_euryale.AAC.7
MAVRRCSCSGKRSALVRGAHSRDTPEDMPLAIAGGTTAAALTPPPTRPAASVNFAAPFSAGMAPPRAGAPRLSIRVQLPSDTTKRHDFSRAAERHHPRGPASP